MGEETPGQIQWGAGFDIGAWTLIRHPNDGAVIHRGSVDDDGRNAMQTCVVGQLAKGPYEW
jgi:hypothetical protein